MDFGKCKVCRSYGMLVHEGACSEHSDIGYLMIRVGFMNMDEMRPSLVSDFSNTIRDDMRVAESEGEKDIKIVLSDLEIIIKDESRDPIQTIEYDRPEQVESKTEEALDWVYSNFQ